MRKTPTIVRVVKALSPDGRALPATIYEKGHKRGTEQFLTAETRKALGTDLAAHFEAEKVGGIYWIGQRLPHRLPW